MAEQISISKEVLIKEIQDAGGLVNWIQLKLSWAIVDLDQIKALAYLSATSRFSAEPFSLIITGESGSGKSWCILWSVLKSIIEEDLEELTGGRRAGFRDFLAEVMKDGKVLIATQLEGLEHLLDLTILLTEHKIRYALMRKDESGRWKLHIIEKELTIPFLSTTTRRIKRQEVSSRFLIVETPSSPEYKKKVAKFRFKLWAHPEILDKQEEECKKLKALNKLRRSLWLQGVKRVVIPFAEEIEDKLPDFIFHSENPVLRNIEQFKRIIWEITLNYCALGLREVKEINGEKYAVAEWSDYEEAIQLLDLKKVALGLTSREEEVLRVIFDLSNACEEEVNLAQIQEALPWSKKTLWRLCRSLVNKGLLNYRTLKKVNFYSLTQLGLDYFLEDEKEFENLLLSSQRRYPASVEQKEVEATSTGRSFQKPDIWIEKDKEEHIHVQDSWKDLQTEEAVALTEQKKAENLLRDDKRRSLTSVPRCGNCRHYDSVRKTCTKYRFKEELLPTHEACSRFEPKSG